MGTDRSVEFEGPCLCGKGIFRIDDCEVDHAWPTATPQWYESYIKCPDCAARFSLQRKGNRFVLIEQAVLHERSQRQQTARTYAETLLSDSEVHAALSQFKNVLASQPSVAAVYRVLNAAGLESCTEGAFRRRWQNPTSWIDMHARPNSLLQIFKTVGSPTERLETMIRQLEELERYASQPPEPFGEAIHVLGS